MPAPRNKKKDQGVNLDALGLEMGNKPPQALDVEEAVLGAMLIEPAAVDEAMEELAPSCFYDPRHRMVFEAMSELVNEHVAVDLLTVSTKLREKDNLEAVGGAVALSELSMKVGAAAHMEFYIKILKQKTIQRDLITASHSILKDSYDDSVKVDDLIDSAQTKIFAGPQGCPGDRLHHQHGHERHPGDAEHHRFERCSLRFPLHRQGDDGLAEIGPYHPGGPSFRG